MRKDWKKIMCAWSSERTKHTSRLARSWLAKRKEKLVKNMRGGCFCCRFSDLMEVADRLREHEPDVIFGEPVGSCTDLSATTIAPIRTTHLDRYRLAPLTVVV